MCAPSVGWTSLGFSFSSSIIRTGLVRIDLCLKRIIHSCGFLSSVCRIFTLSHPHTSAPSAEMRWDRRRRSLCQPDGVSEKLGQLRKGPSQTQRRTPVPLWLFAAHHGAEKSVEKAAASLLLPTYSELRLNSPTATNKTDISNFL